MDKSIVSLAKGQDHYQNVSRALELIRPQITQTIKGKKNVVIKVNFVTADNQLGATNVEAARALLDFLKSIYKEKIAMVEKGVVGSGQGFANYDYLDLPIKYNIFIGDYSPAGFNEVTLLDSSLKPSIKTGFSKLALESDFLISITPAKTHDTGIVTLGLKNIVVGFLEKPFLVHQGCQAFNQNLFLLIKKIKPHLSIIDATVAMEGNGPAMGTPKNTQWVLASLDSVQVDIVATKLMGFAPRKVGYLYYCLQSGLATDDLKKIKILGEKLANCQAKFKPHDDYEKQLRWDLPPTFKEKARAMIVKDICQPFLDTKIGKKLSNSPIKKTAKRLLGFQ